MPHVRSARTAAMLVCAAPASVLAYVAVAAVHPAKSARIADAVSNGPRAAHDAAVRKRGLVPERRSPSTLAAAKPRPYRIAFFGDSVTVGFGASDRKHAYAARVSTWLRMRKKRVVETVNARGGVPVAYWAYAPMPRNLDAAVVALGTNDVRLATPAVRFAQEYRTLTNRIRGASPNAQLLCLSVWSHPGATRPDGVINAQIRAVCPGVYVDITAIRRRSNIRSSDGFHPNDAGYLLIARAVEARLKTR